MRKPTLNIVILPALFFIQSLSHAQISAGFAAQYGFIMPHHNEIQTLLRGHVKSAELFCEKETSGEKEWHKQYNNPLVGLSIYYADLGNPEQIGQAVGLYPHVGFWLLKNNKFRLVQRMGWGLGYLSKRFDRVENYKNIVIGSSINALVNLSTGAEYSLSPYLTTRFMVSLTHFSNASFRQPNLGYNIPSLSLGFVYRLSPGKEANYTDTTFKEYAKRDFAISLTGGAKEVVPAGGNKYAAFAFSAEQTFRFSYKGAWVLSADVYCNTSHVDRLRRDTIDATMAEILQPGISTYYRMYMGKVSVSYGMGVYLYTKLKDDGYFYHRLITRYQFHPRIFSQIVLKSHFFKADFAEIGFGFRL